MTSKTENFYKNDKVAWEVSKPGYLSESGEITLLKDEVINVDLFKNTDWIWTNIPSEINIKYLTFADGYKPSSSTLNTPLSVRNCRHKVSKIDFGGVTNKSKAPILFTEGLTRLEVYSDFLETFNIGISREFEENPRGNLEQIVLSHTPNLTTFSVESSSKLREVYVDDFSHVTSMNEAFLGNISLEYVSPMYLDSCTTLRGMFSFCNFSELPTTLYNTSNVKSTYSMFYKCPNLVSVPLFDTQNVTNMQGMFYKCPNLVSVPLFDTQNVTDMQNMFDGCTNLTSVPLLDTKNVTNMNYMFGSCASLTSVPLFDTSNVTDMSWMFTYCPNLISVPLFNTKNVTDMSVMFGSCTNLTTVASFDMSNVTAADLMFELCKSLTTAPTLNMPSVTSTWGMFNDCTSLTTVSPINMPNVKRTWEMFEGCTSLTTVPSINMPNATNAGSMFENCTSLTSISEINTSNSLKDTHRMFYNCKNLTSIPEMYMYDVGTPSSYDTMNYNYIRDMFYGCTSLTDCGGFKKLRISIDLSDCPLTHESAMNVINKTYLPGYGVQTIKFSRTTFDTLSAEDIEIATKKGWEIATA